MRIGIIGAADIAFRRFLPALAKVGTMEFAGVASRTQSKAERITETFGGVYYPSYEDIIADPTIDAIYLPLPPALHYGWGKRVLESGKHLLMEYNDSFQQSDGNGSGRLSLIFCVNHI